MSASHPLKPGSFFGSISRTSHVAGLRLSELVHAERRVPPRHTHEAAYCSFLLAGAYRERWPGQRVEYERFSAVMHPPGFTHEDEIGVGGARFFCVEFDASWSTRVGDDLRGLWTSPVTLPGEAVGALHRLYREFRDGAPGGALAVEGLALDLVGLAVRTTARPDARRPAWIDTAIECVHASLDGPLCLGTVAGAVNRHPVHVARAFRRWTGESLGDLHLRLRIERAMTLMTSPEMTLADVAAECGFADQSHLTRGFKRVVGLPPGAFRAQRSRSAAAAFAD